MAALRAILGALGRAVGRDLADSFKANNLLFLALLGGSAKALFVLFGFLLLFPLSADPLSKIPAARAAVWPLSRGQRLGLRLASFAFSPVAWAAMLIFLMTKQAGLALEVCGLGVAMQATRAAGRYLVKRDPHWDMLGDIPQWPGRLGGLFRKDLREMLSLLDPYAAALLSLCGSAYRIFAAHPDPAAFSIMSLLAALAMSTCAQSLFGLDGGAGVTRYRLAPLRGWEILLAKDAALLAILCVVLLPLDYAPGLTFGLVALAVGHKSSILLELPQQRWRFASGNLAFGAMQTALGLGLGFLEHQRGPVVLALAAAGCAASAFYYGRQWDRA